MHWNYLKRFENAINFDKIKQNDLLSFVMVNLHMY